MKNRISKKTVAALKTAKAKFIAAKSAKTTTTKTKKSKVARMTSNFWRKLKEAGSYAFGVKWYNLRKLDFTAQTLVEWNTVKGATQNSVLITDGSNGVMVSANESNTRYTVEHKGNVVRVSKDKGFDLAQLKASYKLGSLASIISHVKSKGKRVSEKATIDGRKFAKGGWLLGADRHHQTFTDGSNVFEAKEVRDGDSKHVTTLG